MNKEQNHTFGTKILGKNPTKNNSGKEDRFEEKEYFIQLKEFRTFTTTNNISIKHRLYLFF
jgi:hypothetical protein